MEPRDLVLYGQLVSRDTVQIVGTTAVNKRPNTQTWQRSARSTADSEAARQSEQ